MTTPDVVVYAKGMLHASVCAPDGMTREDVAAAVNLLHPTGISSPWAVSESPTFAGGEPHPTRCNQIEGRSHWLLSC